MLFGCFGMANKLWLGGSHKRKSSDDKCAEFHSLSMSFYLLLYEKGNVSDILSCVALRCLMSTGCCSVVACGGDNNLCVIEECGYRLSL